MLLSGAVPTNVSTSWSVVSGLPVSGEKEEITGARAMHTLLSLGVFCPYAW